MINLNHLYLFYRVAKEEHFTRAAEELFISQPAVSKQVKELERTLGLLLFESNTRRRVQLTSSGQILFNYASRIFALVEDIERAVDDIKGLRQGRLAIGASTTIGTYFLPPYLGQYKEAYPQIEVFLDIENNEQIQHKVVNSQLELGIVEGFVEEDELAALEWQPDELVLITAPDHPLHRRYQENHSSLTLDEALAYPLILREAGSGTRDVLEKALRERAINWKPAMELGSTEAIKRVVGVGLGISFVSYRAIELEKQMGRLVQLPLNDFTLNRVLWLVYRSDRRFSPAAQALLKILNLNVPESTLPAL